MKKLKQFIFIAIFFTIIWSCSNNSPGKSNKYRYQIENVSLNNKITCIIDVRIGNIYDLNQLEELSDIIKSRSGCIFDRVYISYFLPGMDVTAAAWAVAEFTPDFKLNVLGKVKQNFVSLKSYKFDTSVNYLVTGLTLVAKMIWYIE